MAFNIILQRNDSERIAVNKDLTTIVTLTGTLRDDSSIIDPIILIESGISNVRNANYLTVSEFGRSYFINDITLIRTNLVELKCHVDVLSSFADSIKANKGIVFRQESDWNLYLNDGVLEVYQNPIVTTHKFPNGFDSESYVLTLAGRPAESLTYGTTIIEPSGIQIGAGGNAENVKTAAGLAAYAYAQLGNPYWFGTFGQTANSALLENRKNAYPSYFTKPQTEYVADFGKRVHDCVGLIKGYRWSDTPTSTPTYNVSQDVSALGLFSQCTRFKGVIGDDNWINTYSSMPGVCVFFEEFSHVGVSMGDDTVVEARGSAYGVVQTNLVDRDWYWWGLPDWLINDTGIPVN